MKSHLLNFLIVVTMLACQSPTPTNEVATLILINGKIWTGNIANPEATAFAVKNDRILAVGTTTDILAYKGDQTEVIDAQNKFVTPGFIDCHVHFLAGGRNLASVQLRDAKTPELFSQRIADFAKTLNKGDWIMGGEWDHELWGGSLPDKEWIDKFTPDNPVFVRRLDGHMALSNSLALKLAGIDKASPSVDGGEIIRNAAGEPTGVLKDNAMNFVRDVMPPPSPEDLAKALNAAMNFVAAQGVTTVHHVAGIEPKGYMEAFEKARADKAMITRIYAMMPLVNWRALKDKIDKEGSVAGTAHRAWMDIKAFLSLEDEESMLEEAIRGEKTAVKEYDDVLTETSLPSSTKSLLESQKNKIENGLNNIKTLEDIY